MSWPKCSFGVVSLGAAADFCACGTATPSVITSATMTLTAARGAGRRRVLSSAIRDLVNRMRDGTTTAEALACHRLSAGPAEAGTLRPAGGAAEQQRGNQREHE